MRAVIQRQRRGQDMGDTEKKKKEKSGSSRENQRGRECGDQGGDSATVIKESTGEI